MMSYSTNDELPYVLISEEPIKRSTNPVPKMANTTLVASTSVVAVILASIVVTVLIVCLYRRRKQNRNQTKDEEVRAGTAHGSNTMRSDKSDHPYENASLTRELQAAKISQDLEPGRDSGRYAPLQGQSLPHHYQGLGQKQPELPEEFLYDELMSSSETTNSGTDYYFKLEPGSRNNSGIRQGGRSDIREAVRPVVDSTDPDQAYDLVVVGNMTGESDRNGNLSRRTSGKATTTGNAPVYYQVERSSGRSFHALPSIRENQPDFQENQSDKGDTMPTDDANLASKNSIERSGSYDRLDRSGLRKPVTIADDDINGNNEYEKLLPRLAVQSHNPISTSSPGYSKVKLESDDAHEDDTMGIDDYNKLCRGVEKELDNLIESDKEFSTTLVEPEDIPIEL